VGAPDLVSFEVVAAETDLHVFARRELRTECLDAVRDARAQLERYIAAHPHFAESFVPVEVEDGAPPIIAEMADAACVAGVGPMAAVAGAIAEAVARALAPLSREVIVENGGDVFVMGETDRVAGLWAGESGVSGVGLSLPRTMLPVAVATSSGTIGPSVSLGRADAATVLARSGALADAAASAVGNRVHGEADIDAALDVARAIPGVLGAVVAIGGLLGAWGEIELVPIAPLD
jgi:hypothetical protein